MHPWEDRTCDWYALTKQSRTREMCRDVCAHFGKVCGKGAVLGDTPIPGNCAVGIDHWPVADGAGFRMVVERSDNVAVKTRVGICADSKARE